MAVARHHPTTRPIKLRIRDDGLSVDRLRRIGFRVECDCGYRGPRRPDRMQAMLDRWKHLWRVGE